MKYFSFKLNTLLFILLLITLNGCQTTPKRYSKAQTSQPDSLYKEVEKIEIKEMEMEEAQPETIPQRVKTPLKPADHLTYHKVKKGQTLWSISRYYSVPLNAIYKANRLTDADRLEIGQILKIPLSERKTDLKLGRFEWPLDGVVVGHYHETIAGKLNNGIDIKPEDSYTVYASRKGKVEFSQILKGYGYTIILHHPEGLNTVYSNLSSSFVNESDSVEARQAIGEVGTDARSKEPHLHFEIRKEDEPINPLRHLTN